MKKYLVFITIFTLFASKIYSAKGKKIETSSMKEAKTFRIAVNEFRNLTGNEYYDRYCTGIGETITGDLSNIKSIKVVERQQLVNIHNKIPKFEALLDDNKTAVELGKIINANIMVIGSIQATKKEVLITARFVNVETAEVIGGEKVRGKEEELFDLFDQIIFKLTDNLGIEVTPSEKRKIEKPETTEFKAYKHYASAKRVEYYEKDREKAKKKVEKLTKKALEIDPNYEKAIILHSAFGLKSTHIGEAIVESFMMSFFVPSFIFEQRHVKGTINPLYETNTGLKFEEADFYINLYKISGRFLLNAKEGGRIGLGFSFMFVGESDNNDVGAAFEFNFVYLLTHWGRLYIFPGIGVDAQNVWFKQKYAYPSNENWTSQLGSEKYHIPNIGEANSGTTSYGKKVFLSLVYLISPPERASEGALKLIFDIGYRQSSTDIYRSTHLDYKKDINDDGKIDDTERVQLKKEWLKYTDYKIGGPYFNIGFGF